MSIDATNWAWGLQNVTPLEKLVLLSFADRAGETHEAWPSWSRLIADTGITRKTLFKILLSIQEKGLIIKTGEKKSQVYVYRLIGVIGRTKAKETSSKMTTSSNNSTSSKMTTGSSSKMTTSTSGKMTTQNHQLNPKRNPKGKTPSFSSFSHFKTHIQELVTDTGKGPIDVLVEEIIFYSEESKEKREPIESVKMAISLIKTGKWKTPHGHKGFSSKAVREKEEEYERKKQQQQHLDGQIAREIHKIVLSDTGKSSLKQLRLITGASECPQKTNANECYSK